MARTAERVYTRAEDIARLEAWMPMLGDGARVAITLGDGTVLVGTVGAMPTMQVFRDDEGGEGLNALLRLEDPRDAGRDHYLWLDQVRAVERLPSPETPGEGGRPAQPSRRDSA